MNRRDLFTGVWKRLEEQWDDLRAERIAEPKQERDEQRERDERRELDEHFDAGGTFRLPKYGEREEPPAD